MLARWPENSNQEKDMSNSTIDLHMHTIYSDGSASPTEILHCAREIGLKTIAITDHDNLHAYPEAAYIAEKLCLELAPGVELTTSWAIPDGESGEAFREAVDVDLLGYYFDPESDRIQSCCREAMLDLRARINEICLAMTQAGFPISIFDVQDQNPHYPGARQVIQALNQLGHASSWNEGLAIFEAFWSKARPAALSIDQAIETIHQAGGVAILAHPVAVQTPSGWLQAGQIAWLVEHGLDGLEIYHPRLDLAARQHFLGLAKRFNLLVSGGSDEHGGNNQMTRLGSEIITYKMLAELKQKSLLYG
jgi:hypothetical protein